MTAHGALGGRSPAVHPEWDSLCISQKMGGVEMTSLALLLWIFGAILLQIAVYLAIGFWNHWLEYRALRQLVDESELSSPVPPQTPAAPHEAAWKGLRTFRVERRVIEDAAQSICSFYLVPEDNQGLPSFKPGQFLTFNLDVPVQGEKKQIVRCYSLSDAPRPDHYRISVKRALPPPNSSLPAGCASSFLHDQIAVGDTLQVRAPSGHFHIDQSNDPIVLIGGGIGITPMLSILNWCLAEQPGREVWLFYGVRDRRELIMASHLEALADCNPNFHLRFCLSNPMPSEACGQAHQVSGRVDVALLRMQLPLKPFHYYICGPSPMMESLVPALEAWGVPDSHIHFEAFGPASIKRKDIPVEAPADAVPANLSDIVVTFAKSAKQVTWKRGTGSLLEFAEANGISVDSGCRAGGCGTCQTTIKSGEVAYRQAPDFDPEAGTCLLCVCTPKTSVTLEA